jgi:hypothetical protein
MIATIENPEPFARESVNNNMRHSKVILLLAASAIHLLAGVAWAGSPAEKKPPALKVRIVTEKGKMPVDKPVVIRVIVRNEGKTPVVLYKAVRSLEHFVIDGLLAVPLRPPSHWRSRPLLRPISSKKLRAGFVKLEPGAESELDRWNFMDLAVFRLTHKHRDPCQFLKPGSHKITYTARFTPGGDPAGSHALKKKEAEAIRALNAAAFKGELTSAALSVVLAPAEDPKALAVLRAKHYAVAVDRAWRSRNFCRRFYGPEPNESIVPGLLELAKDPKWRGVALATLGWLGQHADKTIGPLAKLSSQSKDTDARVRSILAMAWISERSTSRGSGPTEANLATIRKALADALKDKETRVRVAALAAMALDRQLLQGSEEATLVALQDKQAAVRLCAAYARLCPGSLDESTAKVLKALLENRAPAIRRTAIAILERWLQKRNKGATKKELATLRSLVPLVVAQLNETGGGRSSIPQLFRDDDTMFSNTVVASRRSTSEHAGSLMTRIGIYNLGEVVSTEAAPQMAKLFLAARTEKDLVRLTRSFRSWGIKTDDTSARLEKAAGDKNPATRIQAALALSHLRQGASVAAPVLLKALKTEGHREAALRGLARMRPLHKDTLGIIKRGLASGLGEPVNARDSKGLLEARAAGLLESSGKELIPDLHALWKVRGYPECAKAIQAIDKKSDVVRLIYLAAEVEVAAILAKPAEERKRLAVRMRNLKITRMVLHITAIENGFWEKK